MAKGMSLRLYHEWLAYFRRQPLPWKRADMQAALMSMTVHNTIKGTFIKYPKMLRMKDFMLEFGPADWAGSADRAGRKGPQSGPQTASEVYRDLKTALNLSGAMGEGN